jgi:flagellar biosynthesis chaperone FliJ
VVLPIGIFGPNHAIVPVVTSLLGIVTVALLFNRRGKSNVTGFIVSLGLNLGLFTVIRLSPGGLGASSLGLFDLLVFSELFVASLLPVNWVFFAAIVNIAFIVLDLATQQRTASFAAIMATDAYPIIVRPIALHVVVTVVLWLWVRSATQAIERADRAEVIATLEHAIAQQEHADAQLKRQLEMSIQQIVETHQRVANGDFNARVPLNNGNVLWQIAGALNNLLSRFQSLRQSEIELQRLRPQLQQARQVFYELQRTRSEIIHMISILRDAKEGYRPLRPIPTGTMLDPLLLELNGLYLTQLPAPSERGQPPQRVKQERYL